MVPNGWQKQQISDICTLQNGNSFKPNQWDTKGLPIIRIQNLNGSNNFNYYSGEVKEKWLVETGQLLFSWAGTRGVSFGPFVWKKERGVLNQHIYKVYAEEHVDQDWLYESLKWVTNKIEAQAHGFKATLLHVQKKDIDNQPILLPPLPEQRKIAKILSTWDKAISTTEKLIETSKQQKKVLMQQLLTGKKRLVNPETGKAFEGEWEVVKLAELCKIGTGKKDANDGSPSGKYPFFTCAKRPILSSSYSYDFEALLIAGNGVIGTTHYYKGKFEAYQRTYILSEFRAVFVAYLHHWINFYLKRDVDREKQHGAMPYIKVGMLQNFKVKLGSYSEQQKIASALTAADKEIEVLEAKLAHFKQEKKALMQQLLTGKRRVKVDEDVAA